MKRLLGLLFVLSASVSAAEFVVTPADAKMPYAWSDVSKVLDFYTQSGFNRLRGKNCMDIMTSDKDVSAKRKKFFGTFNGSRIEGGSSRDRPFACMETALQNGEFGRDDDAIYAGVEKGYFNDVLVKRAVIQEYLLARLAMGAQALDGEGFLNVDEQTDMKKFADAATEGYKATRFLRNALIPSRESGYEARMMNQRHVLEPIDFFVGAIIVNHQNIAIQGDSGHVSAMVPGASGSTPTIGFLPVSDKADGWQNVVDLDSGRGASGKPVRNISLHPVGMNLDYPIDITPEQDGLNKLISVKVEKSIPISFDQDDLKVFFKNVAPWAVIVEFKDGKPHFRGLANLSIYDFGHYLKFNGINSDLDTVTKAPSDLYLQARKGATNLSQTMKQGLYNGYLESSCHRQLVNSKDKKPLYKEWEQPTSHHYFASNSCIDWKFFLALRTTRQAQKIMNITKDALAQMPKILADPTQHVPGYIGAKKGVYMPVVLGEQEVVEKAKDDKQEVAVQEGGH